MNTVSDTLSWTNQICCCSILVQGQHESNFNGFNTVSQCSANLYKLSNASYRTVKKKNLCPMTVPFFERRGLERI